ncbi:MAG: type II toxin-antitoxin system HicA family toxin [Haliea sp.]
MPPKIKQLIQDLEQAGFTNRGSKGSHRNYCHPKLSKPITISGNPNSDARHYQVKAVYLAIQESKQ